MLLCFVLNIVMLKEKAEMKKQQRTDQHNKCNKDTCMIMF